MAEKYSLVLRAPLPKDVSGFLGNVGIPNSKFVLDRLMKYMDFPEFFNVYCTNLNFHPDQVYPLEKMSSRMQRKVGNVDFTANIIFPGGMDDLSVAIMEKYVLVNLESKLLENPILAEVFKNGKKFNLYAKNVRQ